jgi:hypothetical protein
MKIAFDLDNTLIRNDYDFPTEKPRKKLFAYFLRHEELRAGTVDLFDFCKQQKWEVWIYTTSFRSTFYIRRLFWLYNISLNGVINQTIHNQKVTVRSSKHLPTFGLDLIIDDSQGVKIESEKYNFQAIVLHPKDTNWVANLKSQFLTLDSLHKQVNNL